LKFYPVITTSMMKKKIAFIILIIIQALAYSQNPTIILQHNYKGQTLKRILDSLERTNIVKFYYDAVWIDSLNIPINTSRISLTKVLDSTFREGNLGFIVLNENEYVITSQYKIVENVDHDFFNIISNSQNSEDDQNIFIDLNLQEDDLIYVGNVVNEKVRYATITGRLKEKETGNPVIGASIQLSGKGTGTISNENGDYSLNVKKGSNRLIFNCVGNKEVIKNLYVVSDGTLNIEMQKSMNQLQDVVVEAEKDQNIKSIQGGLEKVDISTIKQLPTLMGEVDVIRSILLLPGVHTVGEGASGFNVRGGSVDQNLILYNEAPIFNSSHLFGFFSAFNSDLIQDYKLHKSGVPAYYGGRISSVLEVNTKEGTKKKFSGSGGVSPVTSKFMIESPLFHKKASFIVGGRTTYSNWILKRINKPEIKNSKASFYDLDAKFDYDLNATNSLSASYYMSHDYFKLNSDTTFQYDNSSFTLKYRKIFTANHNMEIFVINSKYKYVVKSDGDPKNRFQQDYSIDYKEIKTLFTYTPKKNHIIKYGFSSILYNLSPGNRSVFNEVSGLTPKSLEKERAIENTLFLNHEWELNSKLSFLSGFRIARFSALGKKTVYIYAQNRPIEDKYITDSITYPTGKQIKNYICPDFRFSFRYQISVSSSVKGSVSRMHQFLHLLSNTTSISPTDVWKLSDYYIKPQIGDQVSLGYFKNFFSNKYEFSLEGYYKWLKNQIEYKGGALLIMNERVETSLINASGKAYGIELFLKKKAGKLNGWIGYTYSRVFLKSNGKYQEEIINRGEYYPSNYDKPHDFILVLNYMITRRLSTSFNLNYSTGRPTTLPVGKFELDGKFYMEYSDRNEFRISDYFRCDASVNYKGNLKFKKIADNFWSLSIYNLTGRNNTYSVFFVTRNKIISGYKLSIFPRPIVTISYNFSF